jgi:hypothetical protein
MSKSKVFEKKAKCKKHKCSKKIPYHSHIGEMLVLQLSHNLHSNVCRTHMYGTHTHMSGGCVRIGREL